MADDFQDNIFGDSTSTVEILVENNSSRKLLAGHLFPATSLVALATTMIDTIVAKCGMRVSHAGIFQGTLMLPVFILGCL